MLLRIINYLVRITYGGLTLLACILAIATGAITIPVVIMLAGAILLLLTAVKRFNTGIILLSALALIQIAAICTGLATVFNPLHHIIRLCVSAVIYGLYWYSDKKHAL